MRLARPHPVTGGLASGEYVEQTAKELHGAASEGLPQLFSTFSAFLASEARKISKPFFASGLVAE